MPGKSIVTFAIAALLLAVVPALAAEQTPQTYKEQVEPICQANKSKEEILKTVRKEVKEGKLKKASQHMATAAKALKQTYARLSKVPKPGEDAARLTKWLKGIKTEAELLETAGRKLAKGEKNAALKMVVRLKTNAVKTNNLVLDYEFRYCHVDPSKFI
ncbi:MAG TPA: hypothetical protein VFL77_05045 [Solirubrobacterales bacterium]|nr:hypothetical protein [Solirubrobacterales bacterium]